MEAQAGALAMNLCRPAPGLLMVLLALPSLLPLTSLLSAHLGVVHSSPICSFIHCHTLSIYSGSGWILLEEKMQPQPWSTSWEGERKQAQLLKINNETCTHLDKRYWKPRGIPQSGKYLRTRTWYFYSVLQESWAISEWWRLPSCPFHNQD